MPRVLALQGKTGRGRGELKLNLEIHWSTFCVLQEEDLPLIHNSYFQRLKNCYLKSRPCCHGKMTRGGVDQRKRGGGERGEEKHWIHTLSQGPSRSAGQGLRVFFFAGNGQEVMLSFNTDCKTRVPPPTYPFPFRSFSHNHPQKQSSGKILALLRIIRNLNVFTDMGPSVQSPHCSVLSLVLKAPITLWMFSSGTWVEQDGWC